MANVKKQMRRIVRNAAKDFGLGWRVPHAYREAAKQPVDFRKVLFLESSLESLPDSFKALFARFEADSRFDATFVSLGKHRVDARTYLRNCEEFAREAATACLIFLNDASDVVSSLPLRPETHVVQLWHACGAFKRFGMSTADSGYGLSRSDIERHPFYENLSLVTVSSPEVEWAYVEAMHLEGREPIVQPLGVSRTDIFFDDAFHEQAFRHLFAEVPEALGKRVVLYAPTYRGDMSCARAPEMPDLVVLKRALGDECIVLVKQHPMVSELIPIPAECAGFAFEVSERLPIDELLVVSDVLITDYSSVIFEFSLFNRPMVFFAPDLEEYIDDRDFYYDFDAMTPGPVVSTSVELAGCLARLVADEDHELQDVNEFRRLFMSSCDGHATDRIFDVAAGAIEKATSQAVRPGFRRGPIRRPHVRASRFAFNAWYRIADRRKRGDEVVFISRQADVPSYDFEALAHEFQARGWRSTMHLKAVTKRNLVAYARHVIVEIWLLGRCKLAIVDRYDPVVCLLDFDCEPRNERLRDNQPEDGQMRSDLLPDAPLRACGQRADQLPSPESERVPEPVNLDYPRKPVILQLWHAFGSFKKFGYQSVGTPEAQPADVFEDYRIHRNFSWVVCSGEQSRRAFAEAFACPVDRVVALNRPEFDELVSIRRKLKGGQREGGGREGERRPRVLMAPTRRFNGDATHPFRDLYAHAESFEKRFDADFTWAFHPLDEGLPAPGNVSDKLVECDVLVTDYSSIVYEAYVLGKPTLFYIPDIDEYREVPGLNCDPAELSPDLCAYDEEELAERLSAFLTDSQGYPSDQYEHFAARAFDYTIEELDSADINPAASTIADFCEQAIAAHGIA